MKWTTHKGEAGFRAERKSRVVPGTLVAVYIAEEQGIDTGGDRYAVVCDAHGNICADPYRDGALHSMRHPELFCEECQALTTTPTSGTRREGDPR